MSTNTNQSFIGRERTNHEVNRFPLKRASNICQQLLPWRKCWNVLPLESPQLIWGSSLNASCTMYLPIHKTKVDKEYKPKSWYQKNTRVNIEKGKRRKQTSKLKHSLPSSQDQDIDADLWICLNLGILRQHAIYYCLRCTEIYQDR